ncbi:MAG: enoyl-CoA hydratase/isomerase family protein [Pigmentiphaga sp.]|uniref:enoyl-CoA hydratase/isomerase family protein n=1 Tax=Pigmentiphaga sp. TaxID=1977564 RepID=UPI0029BDAA92|nr:enoyl-CoA hydratase/isomerase family protein [Pigmentiphaga sp.]MDX3906318.1 enoyl-CoA hydratase/isomerase family protein [Pigmentiphaga sp.]
MNTNNESPVVFKEINAGQRRIGVATLNRPAQVNALTLEMCSLMLERLRAWQSDEDIVAVVLQGAGEKGFCAGGDVAQVVREVRAGGPRRFVYGDAFFTVEYDLDLLIHTYAKPLVSVAHGITMGGGVGLTVGASHRIVSQSLKMAMPEIHIGLFPDVGGGWFLNRTPPGVGLLMALTGLMISEADALYCGLADWCLSDADRQQLLDRMADLQWTGNASRDSQMLDAFFASLAQDCGVSNIASRSGEIRALSRTPGPAAYRDALAELAGRDDWWRVPSRSLSQGSPTAAAVTWEYMRRSRQLSVAQTLELDLVLAKACQRGHDFIEGVRALLIDKDRAPKWSPATFQDVDADLVARHFR